LKNSCYLEDLNHKLFIFQHELRHFVSNFDLFISTRVFFTIYQEFQKSLDKAKDLDSLIELHDQMLSQITTMTL